RTRQHRAAFFEHVRNEVEIEALFFAAATPLQTLPAAAAAFGIAHRILADELARLRAGERETIRTAVRRRACVRARLDMQAATLATGPRRRRPLSASAQTRLWACARRSRC